MVWDIWSLDCDGHCFGKHRLLSSHRIERMDSSLTYLRVPMCQRVAVLCLMTPVPLLSQCLVCTDTAGRKCRSHLNCW